MPTLSKKKKAQRKTMSGRLLVSGLSGQQKLLGLLIALAVTAVGIKALTSSHAFGIKTPEQGILLVGPYNTPHGGFNDPNLIPAAYSADFSGIIVNANWSDLQPTPWRIAPNNVIDQALAAVQTFNYNHPNKLTLKLRVFAGIYAPQWVKTMGGFQPVTLTEPASGYSGTIGPYWRNDYLAAYANLQKMLAAKYDGNPLIHEVAISACMTVFAETFQRDDVGYTNLFSQGLTYSADRTCLAREIGYHQVWQQTPSSLALNPYHGWYNATTRAPDDVSYTLAMMNRCRTVLGSRCVLENNSIRQKFITNDPPDYAAMYQGIQASGKPITLQTDLQPGTVGDLNTTINWGISLGAGAIEVPDTYGIQITPTQLQADNQALLASTAIHN